MPMSRPRRSREFFGSGYAPSGKRKQPSQRGAPSCGDQRWARAGRLQPSHPLAQLLIDAARLFEAMAAFQDNKVIEKFLFADPPLHPRRSLDQAYFWKLRTTCRRDRDQVVYRYTSPRFHHSFHLPDKDDDEAEMGRLVEKARARKEGRRAVKGPRWQWSGHGKFEDDHGCEECESQIRKTARAVMVDQLWMWILDENTILTCFPRRYGIGKKDPSGVHHSIRRRLQDQNNSANNLRSVFDLGLIILEECLTPFRPDQDGRHAAADLGRFCRVDRESCKSRFVKQVFYPSSLLSNTHPRPPPPKKNYTYA